MGKLTFLVTLKQQMFHKFAFIVLRSVMERRLLCEIGNSKILIRILLFPRVDFNVV